jgi:hypothetical protein
MAAAAAAAFAFNFCFSSKISINSQLFNVVVIFGAGSMHL